MSSRHLLTYIKKDDILSVLRYLEGSLEVVVAADFPSSSFGRCHIHPSLSAFTCLALHHELVVGRVEVCKSVVVPEDTVSLVGHHERYGDLGVHLCEASCKTLYIEETVLELAKSVEVLVLRRVQCQRCLARCLALHHCILELVGSGLEDLFAVSVCDLNCLCRRIHDDCHSVCEEGCLAVCLDLLESHLCLGLLIYHLRHLSHLTFRILYAYGVILKCCKGKGSFTELHALRLRAA